MRCVAEQGSGAERDIPVMTVPELVRYWGYPVEEHWVTTEDGYILGKLTNILVRSMQNRSLVYKPHCTDWCMLRLA